MEGHFTYFSPFIADVDTQKYLGAVIVGIALVLIGRRAASRIRTPQDRARAVIPESSLTLSGFFDFFVEAFAGFQDSILGRENRKYLPFTGTIFLFLLVSNLVGLIPGVPAITNTVWVNVGMAVVVFVYFNYLGIKSHGIGGYLAHFFGTLTKGWLLPFGLCLFALELCFTLPLRILTLNLRLYWNIGADHTVLALFTNLVPYVIPVAFYVLGTFVCFMQAFIFTTLTMVYILLATQHEDHPEEHAAGKDGAATGHGHAHASH